MCGASGENRTPTLSLETDFESAASTNSATEASGVYFMFLIYSLSNAFHIILCLFFNYSFIRCYIYFILMNRGSSIYL